MSEVGDRNSAAAEQPDAAAGPFPGVPLGATDPRHLGDYTLLRVLGEGSMGRVYLGRSRVGRLVAVKLIRAKLMRDGEYLRRFRSEIERAKQVPSFSTAEVLDAAPEHDPPYLVVEFVDGPSLDDVVERHGPLTPANLHGVAIGIAAALRAIHEAGVIHRDLKPSNVLLARGSPKVIDFGIARPVADPVTHTVPGGVVGSIPYMSPERFYGRERGSITAAADIFAWGAVITFAGTGRIPFPADSTAGVLTRIITGDPDLTGLVDPLRGLVALTLAKDPGARPTARELIDQLTGTAVPPPYPAVAAASPTDPAVPDVSTPRPGRPAVPRQLPAPPRSFTGRALELSQLEEAVGADSTDPATVAVVSGIGGIGKTSLALRWAHDNRERFPDGQLYVNLRGFEPAGEPVAPAVALRNFLEALGAGPAIPADMDAQAALYRTLMVDKRMLVVLDNARDTAQVTPLLPASPDCTVLVTSRHRLAGLVTAHGARLVALDVLSEPEGRRLLVHHLGRERIAAEPDAVTALLRHCAGLPLALGIVAARAAAHSTFSLAVLAGELLEESTRLDVLDAGELSANVAAVFSSSYRALTGDAATTFRLLGLVPGPDVGVRAVASLIAMPEAATRRVLRDLVTTHLLQEHLPGRVRMHDLVRLYAADRATSEEPAVTRDGALRRLVDYYRHSAYVADRLLYGHRPPITMDPPEPGCTPEPLSDRAAAMTWFDTNHTCLLAAHRLAVATGWDEAVWQLAWGLTIFHWRRGRLQDHRAVWQAGLAAAERLGDLSAQAHAHRLLGHAYGQAGMHAVALDHLRRSLALSEQADDHFGQGHTHQLLAWVCEQRGDDELALVHAHHALRLARRLDNPVWTAIAFETVGWCHARIGQFERARRYCERALTLHRGHNHPEGEADTLQSLGYIAHHTSRYEQALRYYLDARELRRALGDAYAEATTLERLGETYLALGRHAEAAHVWQEALSMYRAQIRTAQTEAVEEKLASITRA